MMLNLVDDESTTKRSKNCVTHRMRCCPQSTGITEAIAFDSDRPSSPSDHHISESENCTTLNVSNAVRMPSADEVTNARSSSVVHYCSMCPDESSTIRCILNSIIDDVQRNVLGHRRICSSSTSESHKSDRERREWSAMNSSVGNISVDAPFSGNKSLAILGEWKNSEHHYYSSSSLTSESSLMEEQHPLINHHLKPSDSGVESRPNHHRTESSDEPSGSSVMVDSPSTVDSPPSKPILDVANDPTTSKTTDQPSSVRKFGDNVRRSSYDVMNRHLPLFDAKQKHLKALYISDNPNTRDCTLIEHLKANGWQITQSSPSLARSDFQQHNPLLILLDNRLSDLPTVSKSLHCLTSSEDVFFVAIADRAVSDKRRRCLSQADLYHVVLSTSRDTSLIEFFARIACRLRAVPALFAVLDETDQPVEICDETRTVQYVNKAYETVTGCLRSDVLGLKSSDLRRKSVHACLNRAKDNECVTNVGEGMRRASSDWHCIHVPGSSNSLQYVYMKRGSADAAMGREMSVKSLRSQSAITESSINEVLILLWTAIQTCDEETKPLLRDAVRVLSSSEPLVPSLTRFGNNDRITTGYYDGLIRLYHPTKNRRRSVVDALKEKRIAEGPRRISADVKNALSNDHEWSFDVLNLERITENHALTQLGEKIFNRWNLNDTLMVPAETISRWLITIESHYNSLNPYHNATHAADVLQATSYFLEAPNVAKHVQDTHATAALIAATVHDLDHPGRGNAFLINTRQSLALLYNDQSVLENHHVALAFQLTLQPSCNINIFAKLSHDEFTVIRQAVVEMVLSTDMFKHFEYLGQFQQMLLDLEDTEEHHDTMATSMVVCRMMIKCADIGNPTREWSLCQRWAMRIVEEYFDQTKEEHEKNLPLTMELFDRNTCNVPRTQVGFIDMFAREAFTSWSEFAGLPELLRHLEDNYQHWKAETANWNLSRNVNLLAEPKTSSTEQAKR